MVQACNNSLSQGKMKSVRVDLQGPNASGTALMSPLLPLCRLPQVEVAPSFPMSRRLPKEASPLSLTWLEFIC